eukprot:COSAG05_NODE_10998_length_535_cov_1.474771_1_plen_143_part_10
MAPRKLRRAGTHAELMAMAADEHAAARFDALQKSTDAASDSGSGSGRVERRHSDYSGSYSASSVRSESSYTAGDGDDGGGSRGASISAPNGSSIDLTGDVIELGETSSSDSDEEELMRLQPVRPAGLIPYAHPTDPNGSYSGE